jgi:hypothetical protein
MSGSARKPVNVEQLETNRAALPEFCFVPLPVLAEEEPGTVAVLKFGEVGYFPFTTGGDPLAIDDPALYCENENSRLGLTRRQVEAMTFGSMFGWDTPGADPAAPVYDRLEA